MKTRQTRKDLGKRVRVDWVYRSQYSTVSIFSPREEDRKGGSSGLPLCRTGSSVSGSTVLGVSAQRTEYCSERVEETDPGPPGQGGQRPERRRPVVPRGAGLASGGGLRERGLAAPRPTPSLRRRGPGRKSRRPRPDETLGGPSRERAGAKEESTWGRPREGGYREGPGRRR